VRLVGDQDAGVAGGLGIDADDDLAVEVFGDVGDQTVLADGDDDVVGGEQEPGQVGPLDQTPAPVGGDGGGGRSDGGLHGLVAGSDVFDAACPGFQEVGSLAERAVPVQ
jgi:hypothetical protein